MKVIKYFESASAQEFNAEPLKAEIEGIEQQIKETRIDSDKYSGGLIKSLLESRIQILEHTKAMLDQRLSAGNYRVNINYSLEGNEYTVPDNKDELLQAMESEALRISQEMEKVQKEADQYSGGLIRVTKLSTVAIHQQELAMIEMKRCALIYDIPLFSFEGGNSSSSSSKVASEPVKVSQNEKAEIDHMFEVNLTGKRVFKANYSDHLGFNLLLINNTEKDIRAVQGVLIFMDLFDAEIMQLRITIEDDVPARASIKNNDYSFKINKFTSEHNRLKSIEMENLKVQMEVNAIIFQDGSTIKR